MPDSPLGLRRALEDPQCLRILSIVLSPQALSLVLVRRNCTDSVANLSADFFRYILKMEPTTLVHGI